MSARQAVPGGYAFTQVAVGASTTSVVTSATTLARQFDTSADVAGMLVGEYTTTTVYVRRETWGWPTYARITWGGALAFTAATLWPMLGLAFIITHIATNGFGNYFQYLTNWSWTLMTLFFLVNWFGYLDAEGRVHRFVCTYMFWLTYGVAWAVFWLLFLLLADNPGVFTDPVDAGTLSMSEVLIGDRVVHVLPPLALSIFLWHRWTCVAHGVWWVRHPEFFALSIIVMKVLADVWLLALAFVFAYLALNDALVIYNIASWVLWVGALCAPFMLALFVGVPYVVASRHWYHIEHDVELRRLAASPDAVWRSPDSRSYLVPSLERPRGVRFKSV